MDGGSIVSIVNTTFNNTRSEGRARSGGAIYLVGGSTLTIDNSTFIKTESSRNGYGGVLYLDGASSAKISNSSVKDAKSYAIYAKDRASRVEVIDVVFRGSRPSDFGGAGVFDVVTTTNEADEATDTTLDETLSAAFVELDVESFFEN